MSQGETELDTFKQKLEHVKESKRIHKTRTQELEANITNLKICIETITSTSGEHSVTINLNMQ